MLKKLLIISFCFVVGVVFSTLSFSQDDPAATDPAAVEDTTTDKAAGDTGTEGGTATGPEAKTYYNGENTYVNSSVQFKLQAKDNIALDKIFYRVDNNEIQEYQNPFTIANEGIHNVSYYGVDKIGNQEEAKVYQIVVDTTAPDVAITANTPVVKANGKIFISKNFNFAINSVDRLSGVNKVEYSLNGETKEYVAPFSIASEGEVELKVKAIDNVNNATENYVIRLVDPNGNEEVLTGATNKFAVDNASPTVQITPSEALKKSANDKNIASIGVKYAVAATDNDSGIASIQIRIDGQGDFVTYINEIRFKTNGEHTIEAKALDRVGNVSDVQTLAVFVDVVAPESRLETIPE